MKTKFASSSYPLIDPDTYTSRYSKLTTEQKKQVDALICAAKESDEDQVETLLCQGALPSPKRHLALHYATYHQNEAIIEKLAVWYYLNNKLDELSSYEYVREAIEKTAIYQRYCAEQTRSFRGVVFMLFLIRSREESMLSLLPMELMQQLLHTLAKQTDNHYLTTPTPPTTFFHRLNFSSTREQALAFKRTHTHLDVATLKLFYECLSRGELVTMMPMVSCRKNYFGLFVLYLGECDSTYEENTSHGSLELKHPSQESFFTPLVDNIGFLVPLESDEDFKYLQQQNINPVPYRAVIGNVRYIAIPNYRNNLLACCHFEYEESLTLKEFQRQFLQDCFCQFMEYYVINTLVMADKKEIKWNCYSEEDTFILHEGSCKKNIIKLPYAELINDNGKVNFDHVIRSISNNAEVKVNYSLLAESLPKLEKQWQALAQEINTAFHTFHSLDNVIDEPYGKSTFTFS